jgi:beta-xylosidase
MLSTTSPKKQISSNNKRAGTMTVQTTLSNILACSIVIAFSGLTSAAESTQDMSNEAKAALSGNPVFEGWYADPEVIRYDNEVWIYPTYSDEYDKQLFFDCFSSKDLINWTKHERILDNKEVTWAKKAMWAPSVIEKDGKYYLFFGANDIHKGEIGGIGVAIADQPQGPFKDLIGKPLINDIVNGAQPIDQYVFKEADGTYYMYYGGWGHCNMVKLNDDFTGLVPFEDGKLYKDVTPKGYKEGPCMFKKDGKYYFMWSEGGWTGPNYSVAYAIADSPFGPFKRIGKILQQDPSVATGAGHHSVLHLSESDDWYIVYHRRPLNEKHPNHRVTCIDRMEFDKGGKIKPVKITFEGILAHPIP